MTKKERERRGDGVRILGAIDCRQSQLGVAMGKTGRWLLFTVINLTGMDFSAGLFYL